jgi:hypothetical protein
MTEQTLTTRPPATSTATATPIPTVPPGAGWCALVQGNPSLRSWERSATTAGAAGLAWWVRWASGSRYLLADVRAAIGDSDGFHEALTVARTRISEAYQAGVVAREQAEERTKADARRQAVQQAPPPPRRRWRDWT